MTNRIIVTAADENYAAMLIELLDSLESFGVPLADAIGVLDLGMSDNSLALLAPRVTAIVRPGWDLRVSDDVAENKPYLRAMTARPFIRDYFPGYEMYLWLDCDLWVQNRDSVDMAFRGAELHQLAIAPHIHQSYAHAPAAHAWRRNGLRAYFGRDFSRELLTRPYLNSGVIGLARDAPHWGLWAELFQVGLDACSSALVDDQAPLNFAIWRSNLSLQLLPATANWLCHLALPTVDVTTGCLCEPHLPHGEIGILHMSGKTKRPTIPMTNADGETREFAVDFRSRGPIRSFLGLDHPETAGDS